MQCKDKLLLQSTKVPPNTDIDDLPADTFSRESGKEIEDCKLKVVYISHSLAQGNSENEGLKTSHYQNPDSNSVKGMAFNKGISLSPRVKRDNADELRMAMKEVLCDSGKKWQQYEEALVAITVEESLKCYYQHIQRPDFWGGESELLYRKGGWGSDFILIAEYGSEFRKGSRKGNPGKL